MVIIRVTYLETIASVAYLPAMALLFAPVEKCRYYWESILSKTPHEKWIVARNFVTFFYRLTFCPITDPHFKVRWYTWFCAVAFIDSDALIVHMLYVNRHQFLEHLQLLYTMGVSAVVRIYYFQRYLSSNLRANGNKKLAELTERVYSFYVSDLLTQSKINSNFIFHRRRFTTPAL